MSTPDHFQVDWQAHLEALPLATWIVRCMSVPSQSQGQYISKRDECGTIFANQACRETLGLSKEQSHGETLMRYLHPEDSPSCLAAWDRFLEGHTARFQQTARWIRPDTKETVTLVLHAQRLLCGDIQGWLRPAKPEMALSRLQELTNAPLS